MCDDMVPLRGFEGKGWGLVHAAEGPFLCASSPSSSAALLLCAARAMLMRADVLLLDEPTNHLDTTNVAWLESYLNSMPVSAMAAQGHGCLEHQVLRGL